MKASDLVSNGETALALLTDGTHLVLDGKGAGQTGNWAIDPQRKVETIIIYLKQPTAYQAEILLATPVSYARHIDGRRFVIELANAHSVGTTTKKWCDFVEVAKGARNPVHYVSLSKHAV